MPDGPAANVWLGHGLYRQGRLGSGDGAPAFQRVLQGQPVDQGGHHAGVIGGGAFHPPPLGGGAAPDVAAADDNGHLDAAGVRVNYLVGDVGHGFRVDGVRPGAL